MTTLPTSDRRYLLWLLLIVAAGIGLRLYLPWPLVYTGTHVNLFETDAWYHLRVIENLVAQFPHRLIADPYVSGDPAIRLPPLLDYLVAGAAWLVGRGHPPPSTVLTIAVATPPMLAGVTILLVGGVARRLGGVRVGLYAALLAAILPGHFLDRTLLGYVDHHALEALVSTLILYLLTRIVDEGTRPWHAGLGLGAALLVMRLTWTSASMLFAIVTGWLALHLALSIWRGHDPGQTPRIVGIAALTALGVTLAFPRLEPFGTTRDAMTLSLLAAIAFGTHLGRLGLSRGWWSPTSLTVALLAAVVTTLMAVPALFPAPFSQLRGEFARFSTTALTSVAEARPLFLYEGTWSLRPAWMFFRTGFVLGLLAVAWLAWRWWRAGRAVDLLLVVWTLAMYAATIGVNRFGYYLVPAIAIVGGALCVATVEAGRRAGGWRRHAAIWLVAGGAFGINLGPTLEATVRPSIIPAAWLPAFDWLRTESAEPFGDARYYYARYPEGALPSPTSTVMTWWDYGYTVLTLGRRVPVANPSSAGDTIAARFFSATDERIALSTLAAQRARYVFMDEQLPFWQQPGGVVLGKFEAVSLTAGIGPSQFYAIYFVDDGVTLSPIVLFHEDYYRTMTFRLGVLGGEGTNGAAAAVVSWRNETLPGIGPARIVSVLETFDTYPAAAARRAQLGAGLHALVGIDPAVSPVALPPLRGLRRTFATDTLGRFGQGAAQVFEVTAWPAR